MAKQRYINTKFWDDYYIANLDPSEKLVFLYLLTNPSTTICGIYEIPKKRIAVDTGFSIETIENIIKRFSDDKKIHYVDGYVIIINFLKHQNVKSPKIKRGVEIEMEKIPEYIKKYGIDTLLHSNSNSNSNANSNADEKKLADKSAFDIFKSELKTAFKHGQDKLDQEVTFNGMQAKNLDTLTKLLIKRPEYSPKFIEKFLDTFMDFLKYPQSNFYKKMLFSPSWAVHQYDIIISKMRKESKDVIDIDIDIDIDFK